MRIFQIGLALHVLPFLLYLSWPRLVPIDPQDFNPWIVLGAVGVAGSILTLLGCRRLRTRIAVVIFSLVGVVGWGSWFLVGVQFGVDEPVINITGVLVLLSTVALLGLAVVEALAGRRKPGVPPESASGV